MRIGDKPRIRGDERRRMITETSAFLSWAMRHGGELPRIPARRVSRGGFEELMRHRGARAAVVAFWDRALKDERKQS